jgi:hypothetical protein
VADRRWPVSAFIHRRTTAHRRALTAGGLIAALAVTAGVAVLIRSDPFTRTQALGNGASAEARALDEAHRLGRPVRVDSLTDATTEVWARPEGDFRADLSVGAVRTRRSGAWVPVDLNLRAAGDTVEPVAHPNGLVLAGARGDGTHDLATVGEGDQRIAMRWTGRLPAPRLRGTEATYPDALPGVDLVVSATRDGFAQSLIVKDRAAADRVARIELPLTGPGAARFTRDGSGAVTFSAAGGTPTATVAQPLMWDAARDATGTPTRTSVIRTAVRRTADGAAFTLTPDRAWLRDARTTYPVVLDPTVATIADTFDIYVKEGSGTAVPTSNDLQIGLLSGKKTRAFLTWNSSVLAGKQITASTVKFFNFWSNVCAAKSWSIWPTATASTTTVWSNQPAAVGTAASASSTQTQGGPSPCTDQFVSIDGKAFFQHFATAASTRAYMLVRATDETDLDAFKQFRSLDGAASDEVPTASVTYNAYPTVTARSTVPATTCVTGASRPLVNSLTPQLKATVSDADSTLSVAYEWWSVDSNTKIGGQTLTGVATGTATTVTVPAGAFADGGRYKWRVQAGDGVSGSSSWSSFCEMTTWVTVPPVAGCPGTGVANDYNGDGLADVAIGDPGATVNGQAGAGSVTISYGGTGATQLLQQGADGVGGGPEVGDQFGFSLATYDANRDGCADLAVGIPGEAIGTVAEAGAVSLLLGSPAGLSKGPASLWYDQGVTGWGDDVEAGDWFGYAVAAGTTTAGEPFLAVGAPGEDIGTAVDAGIVHYRRGLTDIAMWGGAGVPGGAENDDRVGSSLAATPDHLAVGSPGEAIGTNTWSGTAIVYTHEVSGTALKLVQVLADDPAETGDPIVRDDNFGKALAMVPYPAGGTGASLLAVGAPGKEAGAVRDAGKVYRYVVTPTASTLLGSVTAPAPAEGDYFGEQVRIGGATPQLAIGAPGIDAGDSPDAGAVFRLPAAGAPVAATAYRSTPDRQRLLGAYLGSSPQSLFVADPRAGTVTAFPWTSVAAGNDTPSGTWTAGGGAGAFGTAVS